MPWLSFATSSPNSPTTITFIGNPAGLAAGVYNTVANISSQQAATAQVVVVLTINAPTVLSANPGSLQFNYSQGGTIPVAQALSIASSSPTAYTAAGSAKWLLVGGGTGQTPGTVTVGVDPSTLLVGTTNIGYVSITPNNGFPAFFVPIVFFVSSSPQLTVSPGPLTFNFQIGGTNNITQKNLTINSSGSQLAFNAIASVNPNSGGVQWLSVSPTAAGTPATLAVTVTPGTLPVGTYIGTVTLNSASASNPTQNVQVTLNVSAQPLLDLSTNGLNYSYQTGGALPADQTVIPNATSANLNYTIAVSTNNTGNWLTYAANGVTPAAVTVSVNPVGLPPGNYSGTLTFNAINGGNNPQTVQVALNVSSNPTLSVNSAALTFNFETGQANPPLQTVSVSSSAGAIGFSVTSSINTTSNGVTWLLLGTPTATTTPASFTVGVSANGMAPGTYTGTIVLNAPGITNPNPVAGCPGTQCISVTLNISNTALLSTNPSSMTFSPLLGNSPSPQTVTVNSTGEAVTYTVTAAVTSPAGGNWLVVGPPSGPASSGSPSSFFVGITSQSLTAGTYKATITVHPTSNSNPDVIIPVTLAVSLGNLTVTPTTLTFTQPQAGTPPQSQTINVASTGAILSFSAFSTNTNWLTVTPGTGTTPGQVTVSVNGSSLQPGNYSATVNIVATGAANSPQSVTVNLTVGQGSGGGNVALNPTSLSFTSQFDAAAPSAQTVALTLGSGSASFTATPSVTTPQGGGWLKVSPGTGTASATVTTLNISVDPTGLNPGTYNGTVAVTAAGATQNVAVTYTVTSSGTGGGATRILPQFAFGGGWYSALYFTNTTGSAISFTVTFTGDDGQPLNVPALGGSTVTVNLAPRGTAIIEAPNSGSLSQGYVSVALPSGVTGYGVFRQSLQGLPDQEAVVPLSGTTATTSTLIFDDTKGKETAAAVVNLSSFDTVVTAVARDSQGNNLGSGTIAIPARQKKAVSLRNIQGLSSVVGNMGSVDLTVNSGNLAALGIRFNGPAFTSVPTTDR